MDPYYLIKMEVTTGAAHLRELVETRDDMLGDARGINPEVFRTLGIQLTNEIAKVSGLVQDIEETIEQVRANPTSFGISNSEITAREEFVKEMKSELSHIEERAKEQAMNQRVVFHVQANDRSEHGTGPMEGQTQVLAEREETINLIEENVNMQLLVAREIDTELESQREIMFALDENIDNAHDAMQEVTRRVKQLIENEGTVPTTIVVLLSIALVVLLFLAV